MKARQEPRAPDRDFHKQPDRDLYKQYGNEKPTRLLNKNNLHNNTYLHPNNLHLKTTFLTLDPGSPSA